MSARRIERRRRRSDSQKECADRAKHQEEAAGNPQQSKVHFYLRSDYVLGVRACGATKTTLAAVMLARRCWVANGSSRLVQASELGLPTGARADHASEGWCGRGDSNPHGIATASPSSWCVCQFRHFRRREGGPNRPPLSHTPPEDEVFKFYWFTAPGPAAVAAPVAKAPAAASRAAVPVPRARRAPRAMSARVTALPPAVVARGRPPPILDRVAR